MCIFLDICVLPQKTFMTFFDDHNKWIDAETEVESGTTVSYSCSYNHREEITCNMGQWTTDILDCFSKCYCFKFYCWLSMMMIVAVIMLFLYIYLFYLSIYSFILFILFFLLFFIILSYLLLLLLLLILLLLSLLLLLLLLLHLFWGEEGVSNHFNLFKYLGILS